MRNFLAGLLTLFVIFISIWIQLNILNNIPLFGVKPNIGIILVVAIGILCGEKIGISVGIAYGIFTDVLVGKSLGLYTLLYFLIGFFCGKISHGFSKENKSSIIMISAIATILFEICAYVLFAICYGYDFSLLRFIIITLLESLYNIFIAWVFFKPLSLLSEILNKGKRSYYLL